MKCPKCKNEMKTVMHFENGKTFAFHECKYCRTKTHQKRIHFEEIEEKNNNENTSN
jgi:Zn ribbon nucleic-acid-binding protein